MSSVRMPIEFEWDDVKAEANKLKHGVSFETGLGVFLDTHRLDEIDARRNYGEIRQNAIGSVDGVILAVTYTMRGDVARIISVRSASRRERERYGHHS